MPGGTAARFGFCGGVLALAWHERFALQVDHFLVQVLAFRLQRGKLRLRLDQLDTHLGQLG
jgi:hypothetical protein